MAVVVLPYYTDDQNEASMQTGAISTTRGVRSKTRHISSHERSVACYFQGSSTSIFVMYCPGTTMSPRKRLVIFVLTLAAEVDVASAAAFSALEVG